MAVSSSSSDILRTHLPRSAEAYVAGLLAERRVALRVSRPRRSKLGDHRPPRRGERSHRISVNDDLNPYSFLTTLLHEIAHADVWELCAARWRRPKPHGREWKRVFSGLLAPVVAQRWVPDDIAAALASYAQRPAAMSCSDRGLVLALARYDHDARSRTRVEDLAAGAVFRVEDRRVFRLGRRVRTRYLCTEQGTGAEYRVHGLALAEVVAAPAEPAITTGALSGRGSCGGELYCRRRARGDKAAARSACFGSAPGPHRT